MTKTLTYDPAVRVREVDGYWYPAQHANWAMPSPAESLWLTTKEIAAVFKVGRLYSNNIARRLWGRGHYRAKSKVGGTFHYAVHVDETIELIDEWRREGRLDAPFDNALPALDDIPGWVAKAALPIANDIIQWAGHEGELTIEQRPQEPQEPEAPAPPPAPLTGDLSLEATAAFSSLLAACGRLAKMFGPDNERAVLVIPRKHGKAVLALLAALDGL